MLAVRICLPIWSLLLCHSAWSKPAPEIQARLATSGHLSSDGVTGLEFPDPEFAVERKKNDKKQEEELILVKGTFLRKNWKLFQGEKLITTGKKGKFTLPVLIDGALVEIKLRAVGPRGESETQTIQIEVERPQAPVRAAETPGKEEPEFQYWGISAGLGTTYLSYRETGKNDYAAIVLTPKIAVQKSKFPWPRWAVGGNIFITAFPWARISGNTDARFLGINGRIGYVLPLNSQWTLTLYGGFYYLTMMVTNQAYGFTNLWGPQLFPTLSWRWSARNLVTAYGKYSPMMNGINPLPLSNKELATGISWLHGLKKFGITTGLDYAYFTFAFQGVEISSHSASLSVGLIL